MRDLLVCVLRGGEGVPREAEGMHLLKMAVVRLMGADAAREQLETLAKSLGDDVDLAAVLKS